MCVFSIIIPVYNSECYLKRCIASWQTQTFENFELILVDDGSTDNSLSLIKHFSEIDSRIKVFHEENSGVSIARNLGLEKANGEFIGFCDADDLVSNILLETVYYYMSYKDVRVVQFGYSVDISKLVNNIDPKKMTIKEASVIDLEKDIILNKKVMGSVWNKYFKKNDISCIFDPELTHCEDEEWLIRTLNQITNEKVIQISEAFYYYNAENENSVTTNLNNVFNEKGYFKYLESMYKIKNICPPEIEAFINSQIFMFSLENLYIKINKKNLLNETKNNLEKNINEYWLTFLCNNYISIKKRLKYFRDFLYYKLILSRK